MKIRPIFKADLILPLRLLAFSSFALSAFAQSPGAFTPTSDMTKARVRHAAVLLTDGTVLIAGGITSWGTFINGGFTSGPTVILKSAEVYDPSTGTFTSTTDMIKARYSYTATLLADGRVLIAGGWSPKGMDQVMETSAELYDPFTGSFTLTGSMTTGRAEHTATLLPDGKVLITGGAAGKSAELYDPCSGSFAATGDRTLDWADTATLLANGKVLITGCTGACGVRATEIYDPSTGTFTGTGELMTEQPLPTATLLMNGDVLVAGGLLGDFPSFSAELYDPASAALALTGDMTMSRWRHAANLLPDGTVLITGGNGRDPSSAEVYDLLKGGFRTIGSMVTSREWHTATLLNDGEVLIAGGMSPNLLPLASTEVYTPAVLLPAPVLLSFSGDGQGQGAILHAATHQIVLPEDPAVAGEVLEVYLIGLTDGSVITPQVTIGGRMAEIVSFGNAAGWDGLNQINVRAPNGVAAGTAVSVRLNYIGRASNEVSIAVR